MFVTSLVVLALAIVLAGACRRLSRALWDCQVELVRLERSLADLSADLCYQRVRKAARLEQQELVERSVDTAAASAETIHKAVAGVTFGVLDAVPFARRISGVVKGTHDGIAGSVYSTVRGANKEIGDITREYIEKESPRGAGDVSPNDGGEAENAKRGE